MVNIDETMQLSRESPKMKRDVALFKRQYLQMLDPERLACPTPEVLKLPEVQEQLFHNLFQKGCLPFAPPNRYIARVLKMLVGKLETAIVDPDEDEISDDLTYSLAELMCQSRISDYHAAQQKCYITYTTPTLDKDAASITVFESRFLLAHAGTTGLRTWDAALHLGTYFFSPAGRDYILGKNILELGAGTGFLSILCAKYLDAHHVLATDGSPEVVAALQTNILLNGHTDPNILRTCILEWDQPLNDKALHYEGKTSSYDLVIGADVVGAKYFFPSFCAYTPTWSHL